MSLLVAAAILAAAWVTSLVSARLRLKKRVMLTIREEVLDV